MNRIRRTLARRTNASPTARNPSWSADQAAGPYRTVHPARGSGRERSARAEQSRSQDHELPVAHDNHASPAAAHYPALCPLSAKPGRVLGQPQRRPDGAPPMVPVLLPGPRRGPPSHQAV